MDKITDLYISSGYPAAQKLYDIAKKQGLAVSKAEIVKFISEQLPAQLHARAPDPKKSSVPITSSDSSRDFQMDLLDQSAYKNSNRGHNWCFIIEDIFNRRIYAEAIKTKSPVSVLPALENAFAKLGVPMRISSDDGSEWKGVVGLFLESQGVHLDSKPHLHTRLGIIDSLSRFIKNAFAKHFTATHSTNWIDYIPRLISGYHNSPHGGLPNGYTPNEALDPITSTLIRDEQHERILKAREKGKPVQFAVGDKVRVLKRKGLFDKGYLTKFSVEVFTVESIDGIWIKLNNSKRYRSFQLRKASDKKADPPVNDGEQKEQEPEPVRDVQRQDHFDKKTEQILKHKEGVSIENKRVGLRERKPTFMAVDDKYGKVSWG
jgi:hypothetical protein